MIGKGVGLAVDRTRTAARAQLHLAGRQLRVLGPGHAPLERSLDGQHELVAHVNGGRVRLGCGLGVDDDLGDAVAIAQVDEDQLAHVAPAIDPARERDLAPSMLGARVTASEVSVGGLHDGSPS